MSDLVTLSQGERMVGPLAPALPFSEGTSRHHRPFLDDYAISKMHIMQSIGDIGDIDIFGRQVLCAVFCRPNVTPKGFYIGAKEVKEDWWQHKVVMVLKLGPEAFKGDDSYHNAVFGDGIAVPQVGDWLVANASAGIQISLCGDGGARPKGKDHHGHEMDIYEWDGWPCRIIGDDCFLGRITKPHGVI